MGNNFENSLPFVLPAYGLHEKPIKIELFGSGLINHTWKISTTGQDYILQKLNHTVFKNPESIAHNIKVIADYLQQHHPGYLFIAPLASKQGSEMVYIKDLGFFRLFPFVTGSHSKNVVETAEEAYEAAVHFGRFTRLLKDLNVDQLQITIPHFHDLGLRYAQFLQALENGDVNRINQSKELILFLTDHADIVNQYKSIRANPEFKLRVTHHDTKISNVLFDPNGKGLCIVDLDTVMPGYFISDVGDMMRTYLSPVSEEEKDFSKITVRDEFYKAIVEGYYSEMKSELTETEKRYFFYAGECMIYMQALRFLTDHINNDVYYGAKYEGHNLIRANNQIILLQKLLEKQDHLQKIVSL